MMTSPAAGIELTRLDLESLRERLPGPTRSAVDRIEVLDRIDSTNSRLMEAGPVPDGRFRVCVAEEQTAGRGRRGRSWVSPRGASLYLSLAVGLAPSEAVSGVLALALGVGVAETLQRYGAEGIGLKWPNDLCAHGAKLGGILVESRRGSDAPGLLVAGLGLNLCWTREQGASIDRAWTDLSSVTPAGLPDRNALAAAMIATLWGVVDRRASDGLDGLQGRYAAFDILRGREAVVQAADGQFAGRIQGLGPDGELCLRIGGRDRLFSSAEVSVRPLP